MSIFLIIYYISKYKLYQKLGYNGYECFIPVYDQYLLCKKIDISNIFMFIYLVISFIVEIFNILINLYIFLFIMMVPILQLFMVVGFIDMLNFNGLFLELCLYSILLGIYMIMRFIIYYKVSLNFNNKFVKSIFLGIFNFIGVIVIGFDNSKYVE